MTGAEFEKILAASAREFETEFEKRLRFDDPDTKAVSEAARYSCLAGGKRIRPFLTLEFCRLFGREAKKAMPLACAVECIRTYSLIHDDLPCMDNDDYRRGKPTCHKAYGEEYALLAGDALLTYAFEIVSGAEELDDREKVRAVSLISKLSGLSGMAGGQTIDLSSEGKDISFEKLLKLHSMKTGALIECAALLGAQAGGAGEKGCAAAKEYAKKMGLAFQIADDILDVTSTTEELGKNVGSDRENGKVTFLSFMSPAEAHEYAQKLADEAKKSIEKYSGAETLFALADYTVNRTK